MYIERLKKLTQKQCVEFAVFCAEQALPVFEKEYPNDSRPREAINAANKWLETPHIMNPHTTYAANVYAAADVAVHSANVYAADAAYAGAIIAAHAASHTADAAASVAAFAAARSAAHAAYAAADAAHAAYAAADAVHAATHANYAAADYAATHVGVDKTAIDNYLKELEKCTSID